MINSDQNKDIVCETFKWYLKQGGNSFWIGMKKCSQHLSIFKIFRRVLGLLVGTLLFSPGNFIKATRCIWDFAKVVIQRWSKGQ